MNILEATVRINRNIATAITHHPELNHDTIIMITAIALKYNSRNAIIETGALTIKRIRKSEEKLHRHHYITLTYERSNKNAEVKYHLTPAAETILTQIYNLKPAPPLDSQH